MAWTTPVTHSVGNFIDAADWNNEITNNFNAIVATCPTTITALNTQWGSPPPDGAIGRLKIGTTPFTFIDVRYDTATTKWVSEPEWFNLQTADWNATGQALATATVIGNRQYTSPRLWGVFNTAGLSPQLRVMGTFRSQATGTATTQYVAPSAYGANIGGAASEANRQDAITAAGITTVSSSFNVLTGTWGVLDGAYTVYDTITPTAVMSQSGTGSATFDANHAVCGLRWVG